MHARSSLLQLAAFPRGGLTSAEAPLIDAEILFRQPQPPKMARKRYKPEEIVAKLRQVDVLVSQGQNIVDATTIGRLLGDRPFPGGASPVVLQ